jgi:hypothetical protein
MEKAATTYTPPAPDGGLRWSSDRFSYPERSSNRGGGGRGILGGKDACDPSGSLEYGETEEGNVRCPGPGEPRLKKLMVGSCDGCQMAPTGLS